MQYFLMLIICVGVHYTAVDQGPQIYSPELAAVQLRFFNTIMSNEQALQLLSQEPENRESKMMQHSEYLYKIVSIEEWQKSLLHNEIVLSSMDKDFIHLAKEEQVVHVAQKFWENRDYIVLKLASKKLVGRLLYEVNPGGTTQYYHLYEGNIPLDAVVDVTIVRVNQ